MFAILAAAVTAIIIAVHDGDTLTAGIAGRREIIRIPSIDAAELPPRARCRAEAMLAEKAHGTLQRLLPPGLSVSVTPLASRPRDRYRRLLADIALPDGRDVGEAMIAGRMARPWTGRRHGWCPDLAPLPTPR